jgi:hypothetical protein
MGACGGPSAAARLEGDFGGRSAQVELRPPKKSAQVALRAFENFCCGCGPQSDYPGKSCVAMFASGSSVGRMVRVRGCETGEWLLRVQIAS